MYRILNSSQVKSSKKTNNRKHPASATNNTKCKEVTGTLYMPCNYDYLVVSNTFQPLPPVHSSQSIDAPPRSSAPSYYLLPLFTLPFQDVFPTLAIRPFPLLGPVPLLLLLSLPSTHSALTFFSRARLVHSNRLSFSTHSELR